MSYATGVIFACLSIAILVGMLHQVWAYTRGRQIISRRQFALRLTTGTLLLLTIGMIFYAAVRPPHEPRLLVAYWAILSLLPVVVIILAWLDLREVARIGHQRHAELYSSLAQLQQDVRGPRTPRKTPDEGDQPTSE